MDSSAANSVTNSPISSAPQSPPPPPQQHQEVPTPTVTEDVKEVTDDSFDVMDSEDVEKFKKIETETRKYLISKYFSDKTIFGGNVFDVKMGINGEEVKASRFPGYQSYADPANFKDDNSSDSVSTVETPSQSANGHQPSQ
ncbi:hypothetical protein P3S67_006089 [Capsicum chacoense]